MQKQITIIGGGPVGISAAIGMASLGLAPLIINHHKHGAQNSRVLAMSYGSVLTLKRLGVCIEKNSTPITQIHISHTGLGVTNIKAQDVGLKQLGYTIKYSDLIHNLETIAKNNTNIGWVNGYVNQIQKQGDLIDINYSQNNNSLNLATSLAILADGRKTNIDSVDYTEFDYQSTAIVVSIEVEHYIANTAFERFDISGPLVLLPHENSYIIVWSLPQNVASNILENDLLETTLQKMPFLKRFGKIKLSSQPISFPLSLRVAKQKVVDNIVLIGNCAQMIHPVAAQGLNLGLRDVITLVESFKATPHKYLENLKRYASARKYDSKFTIGFTDFLARHMEKDQFKLARTLGIVGLSNCKSLQNMVANSLIFGI